MMRRSCDHCGNESVHARCGECAAVARAPQLGTATDSGLAPVLGGMRRVPPGDLTIALASAEPGTVLTLGAGTYRLTAPVRLAAGVRLEGAGADSTRLVAALGARMHVHVEEAVTLVGLTIEQAGGAAEVLRATAGHLIMQDCRLEGGACGLWIGGSATLEAEGCVVAAARGPGLHLAERARARLSGCAFNSHGAFGLRVLDDAELAATGVSACANGRGGLAVEGRARLIWQGGLLGENGRRGALVRSGAECRFERATFAHNTGPGLEAVHAPALAVVLCRLVANQGPGAMLGAGTRCMASGNALEDNREDGVAVYGGAVAMLAANAARRNGRFGFWVGSGGEAAVSESEAEENAQGAHMAAWTAELAPDCAGLFGRRADQAPRAARPVKRAWR